MSKNGGTIQNSGSIVGTSSYSASTLDGPEVRMTVFASDDVLFRRFVSEVYSVLADARNSYHRDMPVTEDQLWRYAVTGLWARLCCVNKGLHRNYHENGTSDIRCNSDWQMPAMIAQVLNSIGTVLVDMPKYYIVPQWNTDYDGFLLSYAEFQIVTRKLAILGRDDDLKVVLVRSLERSPDGNPIVMGIVPVRDIDGRIARLHSEQKIDGIAAFVYVAMGFAPELWSDVSTSTHVARLPRYFLHAVVVNNVLMDLAGRAA